MALKQTLSVPSLDYWDGNSAASDNWIIEGAPSIDEGVYYFRNGSSNLFMDIQGNGTSNGANVQQFAYGDYPSEQWQLTYRGDGYYTVRTFVAASKNMVLDARSNCVAGAQVVIWEYDSIYVEHLWRILPQSNGSYKLVPKKNVALSLSVENPGNGNNAKVKLENHNSTSQQTWFIEGKQTITHAATYYIKNSSSNKYAINDAQYVKQEKYSSGVSGDHYFYFDYVSDGYYKIRYQTNGGHYFKIASDNRINLSLNGSADNQLFKILPNSDGTYRILSKSSNDKQGIGIESGADYLYQKSSLDATCNWILTTVGNPKPTITFAPTTTDSVNVGESIPILAIINPSTANQKVHWVSLNTNLATVSQITNLSAAITGQSRGDVIIRAYYVDKSGNVDYSEYKDIVVTVKQLVTSVSINEGS